MDQAPALPSMSIAELLLAYNAEQRRYRNLRKAYDAAEAEMPEWARPGPRALRGDGVYCGAVVFWPMVEDPKPPEITYAYRIVRPSLRETFYNFMVIVPRADDDRPHAHTMRRNQRLSGFKEVRKRIARFRAWREEERIAGLPTLEDAWCTSSDRCVGLSREIIDRSVGSSAEALALMLIIEVGEECGPAISGAGDARLPIELLERLSPQLDGLLKTIVDDIIATPERMLDDLIIGGAEIPDVDLTPANLPVLQETGL